MIQRNDVDNARLVHSWSYQANRYKRDCFQMHHRVIDPPQIHLKFGWHNPYNSHHNWCRSKKWVYLCGRISPTCRWNYDHSRIRCNGIGEFLFSCELYSLFNRSRVIRTNHQIVFLLVSFFISLVLSRKHFLNLVLNCPIFCFTKSVKSKIWF